MNCLQLEIVEDIYVMLSQFLCICQFPSLQSHSVFVDGKGKNKQINGKKERKKERKNEGRKRKTFFE